MSCWPFLCDKIFWKLARQFLHRQFHRFGQTNEGFGARLGQGLRRNGGVRHQKQEVDVFGFAFWHAVEIVVFDNCCVFCVRIRNMARYAMIFETMTFIVLNPQGRDGGWFLRLPMLVDT